jgi:hypothetical protein
MTPNRIPKTSSFSNLIEGTNFDLTLVAVAFEDLKIFEKTLFEEEGSLFCFFDCGPLTTFLLIVDDDGLSKHNEVCKMIIGRIKIIFFIIMMKSFEF